VLASTDILALTETRTDKDETVPVDGYKYITQFKRQDVRVGRVAIYDKNKATTMATPHPLMKLDTQSIARTLKSSASESCGDIRSEECLVNGQKVLVVTVYATPNTPSDDWQSLIFSNLAGYSPEVCKIFNFLESVGCEDMPIILSGDINVNVKDNYNAQLVEFMKDSFELDDLSDLSEGTTRSDSCIDMVVGRSVDKLSCMNCVSYFSYH
jgi:exonuclease III